MLKLTSQLRKRGGFCFKTETIGSFGKLTKVFRVRKAYRIFWLGCSRFDKVKRLCRYFRAKQV